MITKIDNIEKLVTVDTILDYLQEAVGEKRPIEPAVFIDAAQKLNVLLGDEIDLLYTQQQKVAQMKYGHLQEQKNEKKNVSAAEAYIKTTDEYREMRVQEAKVKRIEEFVRIAKLQSRLRESEFRGF